MLFVEIIFWISAVLIAAHYIIFPLVIWSLAYFRPRPTKTTETCPTVTMIVAAYNEEKVIAGKMNNLLNLDYPSELMQLIIVSDGSTDSTPSIVSKNSSFLLLQYLERRGKSHAMNHAVLHATGEIIIFSDANSMLKKD
ncbi:MAG TPA: glycosyltransferase, partial [Ignavibacteria bacterium]|nr:glycosyltransferase [Ignavibacteria bacterium]